MCILNDTEHENWLQKNSQATWGAVAVRSSLRVLPILMENRDNLSLSALRTTLTSCVAIAWPTYEFQSAARDTRAFLWTDGYKANQKTPHVIWADNPYNIAISVAYGGDTAETSHAIDAISRAVDVIANDYLDEAMCSVGMAEDAANAATLSLAASNLNIDAFPSRQAAENGIESIIHKEVSGVCRSAAHSDMISGFTGANLFALPLWHKVPPPKALSQVTKFALNSLAHDEYWHFWENWYQGYLNGAPISWELQKSIARIEDMSWEQGSTQIAKLIQSIKPKPQ